MLSLWKCSETNCYFEDDRVPNQVLVVISPPVGGAFTWLRLHDPKLPVQANEVLKWCLYADGDFILMEEWRGTNVAKTVRVKESSIFRDFEKLRGKTETIELQILKMRRVQKKLEHKEDALRL